MHRMRKDRFNAWQDLDALVVAELEALRKRRPDSADEVPADRGEDEEAFTDEPFDEEADDEEAFIERTAAWLRERPDADALLDAIRAALDDVAEAPAATPSPDLQAGDAAPPAEAPGEG